MSFTTPIHEMSIFLAHAKYLEDEAVESYQEMAHTLEAHHNQKVADIFHEMARLGKLHANEVTDLCQGQALPKLAPWDYIWADKESPESGLMEDCHYLMSPLHALQISLKNEQQAFNFYNYVALTSHNEKVKQLAQEFAEEEAEHSEQLKEWIAKTPETDTHWDHDPDPAHMPE
ncbi:MAG: ferritin-like domain-containing protein [bacterium]